MINHIWYDSERMSVNEMKYRWVKPSKNEEKPDFKDIVPIREEKKEGKRFNTLDDFDPKDKVVIVRVDINTPLDPNKKIMDTTKIKQHASTLDELASKGAKVVVLSHQGRPGDPDFCSLRQHAEILQKYVKAKVKFVDDIIGPKAIQAIKSLKPGEILVLENVRMIPSEMENRSPEEHANGELVKTLSQFADAFVLDGFAVAHRPHASVIGFTAAGLPSYAGRVMEIEVNALDIAYNCQSRPVDYILGGAKPKETPELIEHLLSTGKADKILIGGMIATVFLHCAGYDIGENNLKEIEEKGFGQFYGRVKDILKNYGEKILLPKDVAIDSDGQRVEISIKDFPPKGLIRDIGKETVEEFLKILKTARIIVINGPVGRFEDKRFSFGTVELIRHLPEKSKAFIIAGGGHTIAAIEKYNLQEYISYISSGGGAMLSHLSGEKLPGIEALEKAKDRRYPTIPLKVKN